MRRETVKKSGHDWPRWSVPAVQKSCTNFSAAKSYRGERSSPWTTDTTCAAGGRALLPSNSRACSKPRQRVTASSAFTPAPIAPQKSPDAAARLSFEPLPFLTCARTLGRPPNGKIGERPERRIVLNHVLQGDHRRILVRHVAAVEKLPIAVFVVNHIENRVRTLHNPRQADDRSVRSIFERPSVWHRSRLGGCCRWFGNGRGISGRWRC